MKTDWQNAAEAERKILYGVCQPLWTSLGLTMEEFLRPVFRNEFMMGMGYQDNFRAGRISRKRAAKIYQWLRQHHPNYADEFDRIIASQYGAQTVQSAWENLVQQHGEFGHISIGRPQIQRNAQIQRQTQVPEPISAHVALSQPFTLSLVSPIVGAAICLQWLWGRWVCLPVSSESGAVPVQYGHNHFPTDNHSGVDGFSLADPFLNEPVEAGLHRIVFLILPADHGQDFARQLPADKPIPSTLLDRLAVEVAALPRPSWRLFRTNIMFVISNTYFDLGETKLDHPTDF